MAQRTKSLEELQIAFARDGYALLKTKDFQGQLGILAEHKTACNYETKRKKRVLYVSGNSYQMGYLVGFLAQEDTERMSTKFVDNVIFDFIGLNVDPDKIPIIWGILKSIILNGTKKVLPDVPQTYLEEMRGIVDGCKAANPSTKVNYDDLCMLNFGIDCLLAHIYTLDITRESGLTPGDIQIPVMCNAFSAFGRATKDGKHYFGRDFMFPTAKVFEHTGCMIVYQPTDGRIPLVGVAAPGFVGNMVAMNRDGIAMGVDMSPAGNCDAGRPGFNSLVLVRHAMHLSHSAQDAVATIALTQRGVSWLYPIGDGKHQQAVVVEAGQKEDNLDPLQYPPIDMKLLGLLPDNDFLKRNENQTHQAGMMVRWHDYVYPEAFLQFNKDLFDYHDKTYNPNAWGERGYFNSHWSQENCPAAYFFSPQRENKPDLVLVSNHTLTPSMRLCAMNFLTVLIAKGNVNDIQWRYDELNNQLLAAYGQIDHAKARAIIDFLAPYRQFPDYYKKNTPSSDGTTKIVRGSVSICNLSDKIVESHFGFYADEWVTVTLPYYVD